MADSIGYAGVRPQKTNVYIATAGVDCTFRGEINGVASTEVYFGMGQAATAPVLVSDLTNFAYQTLVQSGDRLQLNRFTGGKLQFVWSMTSMVIPGVVPGGDPVWIGLIASSSNPTGTDAFLAVTGPIDVVAV